MSRTVANLLALAMCATAATDNALAQSISAGTTHGVRIIGTVQTPDGSRLPDATVRIFGTPLITTTDGDGNYVLEATRAPGRLILFAELPNFTSDDATIQVTGPPQHPSTWTRSTRSSSARAGSKPGTGAHSPA